MGTTNVIVELEVLSSDSGRHFRRFVFSVILQISSCCIVRLPQKFRSSSTVPRVVIQDEKSGGDTTNNQETFEQHQAGRAGVWFVTCIGPGSDIQSCLTIRRQHFLFWIFRGVMTSPCAEEVGSELCGKIGCSCFCVPFFQHDNIESKRMQPKSLSGCSFHLKLDRLQVYTTTSFVQCRKCSFCRRARNNQLFRTAAPKPKLSL